MDFDKNILADRLKIARTNKGFTQKELSKKTGVSSVMISAYENKKADSGKNPALGNIVAISKVLGVSVDWLCGLSDNEKSENKKEIDTETFLYSMMSLLDKVPVGVDYSTDGVKNTEICISQVTELYSFVNDYIGIKETVLDKKLLPKGFDEEIIIRGIIEKYKYNSIEKLTTPFIVDDNDLPF